MATSEAQRFELREQLIEKIGPEPTMTLMESLPPVSWEKLATKEDLTDLEGRMNAGFESLRIELGAKIDAGLAAVRGEMGELRGEMKQLRGEVRGEMAELRGETKLSLARQTFILLAALAAAMTPIYIALFTAAG